MGDMEITCPPTDPGLLERLVGAARNYRMSPQEVFDQRVSFVYGQLSGKLTKDQVRAILTRQEGWGGSTPPKAPLPPSQGASE